jgi:threonine efflux protein
MHELLFLASVAALYVPVLLSPGPNFIVLSAATVVESRRHAVVTAIGITSASILYATLAVTGIGALAVHSPGTQFVLRLAGGAYLLYKGLMMARRTRPIAFRAHLDERRQSLPRAYCNGLLTNLTNPQALVFFSSIFATLLSPDLQPWAKPAGVALVAAASISANLATVMLFSYPGVQQRYLRAKTWIDRGTGVLLGGFGIRLLQAAWM